MSASVTLTAIVGPLTGQTRVYTERDTCLLGRGEDCNWILPDDVAHRKVSRHHCLLDINPPEVRLRDLDSTNGTTVNGEKPPVSKKSPARPGEVPGERDLGDGDEIHLGGTVLRIAIDTPAICDRCGCDVPDDQRQAWRVGDGVYLCPRCRVPAQPAPSLPFALPGFTLVKQLGQGGMGVVHLAREDATGREVALKVMLPTVANNAPSRALFLREIRALRVLEHRNIVALLETGEVAGQLYFTMEYCAGGTVRDLLKREGTLSPAVAVPLIVQALDGLEYAHTFRAPGREASDGPGGVIHRDLSPDNLFLAGPVCKLGDYGLARCFEFSGLSGSTRTGTVAGKAHYVCRQQVRHYRAASPELDVWAIAACLYKMLTGATPRDFPEKRDGWTVVLETAPVPIRNRRLDVPGKLADLLDAALDDSGKLAFSSAAAFRAALLNV